MGWEWRIFWNVAARQPTAIGGVSGGGGQTPYSLSQRWTSLSSKGSEWMTAASDYEEREDCYWNLPGLDVIGVKERGQKVDKTDNVEGRQRKDKLEVKLLLSAAKGGEVQQWKKWKLKVEAGQTAPQAVKGLLDAVTKESPSLETEESGRCLSSISLEVLEAAYQAPRLRVRKRRFQAPVEKYDCLMEDTLLLVKNPEGEDAGLWRSLAVETHAIVDFQASHPLLQCIEQVKDKLTGNPEYNDSAKHVTGGYPAFLNALHSPQH